MRCTAWCGVLPGVVYCLVWCTAWCGVLPGAMYCLVRCTAWCSVLPDAVYCLVRCTAWWSTTKQVKFWKNHPLGIKLFVCLLSWLPVKKVIMTTDRDTALKRQRDVNTITQLLNTLSRLTFIIISTARLIKLITTRGAIALKCRRDVEIKIHF